MLVAIAHKFSLPIPFIGVGEGIDDLRVFDADAFAAALQDYAGRQRRFGRSGEEVAGLKGE